MNFFLPIYSCDPFIFLGQSWQSFKSLYSTCLFLYFFQKERAWKGSTDGHNWFVQVRQFGSPNWIRDRRRSRRGRSIRSKNLRRRYGNGGWPKNIHKHQVITDNYNSTLIVHKKNKQNRNFHMAKPHSLYESRYLITGKVPKKIALTCDWYHRKAQIF